MESENESNGKDITVKDLQASLFPPNQKTVTNTATSFFANFFIKTTHFEEEEIDDEQTTKREFYSRELFSLSRELTFVPQAPRWPTECQVLDERIKHISYVPSTPESYYCPSGKEIQTQPTGDEVGIVVYQYTPISAVNYFSRSSVGGSRYLLSSCLCPEDECLRFESRFECGNLGRAIRITPNYYELYLRADLYTNRHMQWFYFRVTNMKKNFLYRFSIVNFSKEDSLYNEGMKPLMYSTKDSQLHSIGWRRCGENITYYSNDNVSPEDPEGQMTYTLTFTTEFPHDDDEVYFAHSYPYTYSDLEDYLSELSNHPIKSAFTTVRLLCKSLAGNNVHHVTITSPPVTGELKKKRAVVVTARVHPGETPSSWMMKGIMDFLTSDCSVSKELRDKFIFKLVPMLNPDGVIVGNNRCSLSAKDLNRQYRTVMRDAYPSIWYTKLMVRRLLEECGVAMYCDLHAHSRKHNIFIYGCENRRGAERKLQEQVFPLMLHKNTADKFSFESCKFRIQKAKEGTGRVVMWMMGIANSYTMETSFAGSTLGGRIETHFSTLDFEQMGKSFCQTLLDFYDEDPRKEKLRVKIINRLVKEGSNADEPTNIQLSDYSSDEGDTSSTSSNEVGRDYEDITFPSVPPPSPVSIRAKKVKNRSNQLRGKTNVGATKSPNVTRKPLPICRATLRLSLNESKLKYSSESSSESDDDRIEIAKPRTRRKLKKKPRNGGKKKQQPQNYNAYSDCEIYYKQTTIRSVSVFDLVPSEKITKSQTVVKRSKTPQARLDRKNVVTQQLSQVQAKLLALKNKLWFGVCGDVNIPLSWGSSNFNIPNTSSTTKLSRSQSNSKKGKRSFNKNKSSKEPKKESTLTKPSTGLRRQTAVDWGHQKNNNNNNPNNTTTTNNSTSNNNNVIKKSKSLPDRTCDLKNFKAFSCGEEERNDLLNEIKVEKQKKKRKMKFGRKAKTISNAKIFLYKD